MYRGIHSVASAFTNHTARADAGTFARAATMVAAAALLALWYPRACGAVDAEALVEPIRVLAGDAMEGRGAGTPGGELAARYLEEQFASIGLAPLGEHGGYRQPFDITIGVKAGPRCALECGDSGGVTRLRAGADFIPFAFSDSKSASGELAFVGFGITAPDLGYDDYAGLDVHGKVVLLMMHEPREKDPKGIFRAKDAYRYSEMRYKIWNAREHGAVGVLVARDVHNHEADALVALRGGAGATAGIVAMNVLGSAADRMLAPAGARLADLARAIDRDFKPHSMAVKAMHIGMTADLVLEKGHAANLVGVLRGSDPSLARLAIVVGAHKDHLGRGGENSLAPDSFGKIHPGADDNASGVAGVLAIARYFKDKRCAHSLVFCAFDGEELGLLGSDHYAKHPLWPLADTLAMLNLDCIGRMSGKKVIAQGADSAREMRDLLRDAASGLDVELSISGDAYGPSDHTSFYAKGIPVAFLFTGANVDYHRPTDTADKINAQGLAKVIALGERIVERLDARKAPLTYVRTAGHVVAGGSHEGSGYGPFFGSIPDFSESPLPGVHLTGVRARSPAENAGLKAGDTIVGFGGVTIKNLYDLTFALRAHRPGDTVDVSFLRDGKEHRSSATLQERR